jgi:hypothetical protein
LLAFLAAGVAGALVFAIYYNEAFREASIDFRMTRGEALAASRALVEAQGLDLAGYREVVVFGDEREAIDFLERNLGLARANRLFRDTVPVWRWKTRWFKELEQSEYSVQFAADGRLAYFQRVVPEKAAGASLDEAAARAIAIDFVQRVAGVDLAKY